MNSRSLLLLPAALALGAPSQAHAYLGFRFNFSIPLYYPAPAYTQVVTYQAQPSAAPERITPAPGPGYVWISGHWSNRAQQWVWLAGHWEIPPSPSAVWVNGHWIQGSAGWVWVDGAWTVGTPPAPPPSEPANAMPQAPSAPPPAPAVSSAPATPAPAPEMADGTVVYADPPAPIVEYVPASPYPGYVWIDGFWGWYQWPRKTDPLVAV
jgi:hypothetical protein